MHLKSLVRLPVTPLYVCETPPLRVLKKVFMMTGMLSVAKDR